MRTDPGDAERFAHLVAEQDRPLRALAFRLLGDREAMDDVLQEAYAKAFRALPRFRGEATAGTWLYRIVYNACLDQLRRERRPAELPLETAAPASAPDPVESAARREALAAALAALVPDQRAAVLLVDAEGFDYPAAARVLGVRVGTLASRLSRARASLRRALAAEPEGVES
ncbi:MAG TPA: sigma-70 family RNA polymerase sigma factor [Gaiellaceae bacterium]|nr:sigma-70 family RNA polymerase sigma factor [Gaiellaceae bacterium]